MNISFLESENTHGTKSLHQNGYLKTFLPTLWLASDLSTANIGPSQYHSTHFTSRPVPRNMALHPNSIQIIELVLHNSDHS